MNISDFLNNLKAQKAQIDKTLQLYKEGGISAQAYLAIYQREQAQFVQDVLARPQYIGDLYAQAVAITLHEQEAPKGDGIRIGLYSLNDGTGELLSSFLEKAATKLTDALGDISSASYALNDLERK